MLGISATFSYLVSIKLVYLPPHPRKSLFVVALHGRYTSLIEKKKSLFVVALYGRCTIWLTVDHVGIWYVVEIVVG